MSRSPLTVAGGAAGAAVLAHLVPSTVAWRQARNRLLPDLAGVGHPDHVALTFDDGPDPRSTPAFLDALDALGWKATFFLLGTQVRQAPGLAAEVVARGHEVGVHGDQHRTHLLRPWTWTTDDLRRARQLINDVTGAEPVWTRPPYGTLAASSLVAARRVGLRTVLWTTWGKDWKAGATARSIAETVARSWHPGATVLLHDSDITSTPGSWRATLEALPLLAEQWDGRGLRVGPLHAHGIGADHQPDRPAGSPALPAAHGPFTADRRLGHPRSLPRGRYRRPVRCGEHPHAGGPAPAAP